MRSLNRMARGLMVLRRARIRVRVDGLKKSKLGVIVVGGEKELVLRGGKLVCRGLDDSRGLIIVRRQERWHAVPELSFFIRGVGHVYAGRPRMAGLPYTPKGRVHRAYMGGGSGQGLGKVSH